MTGEHSLALPSRGISQLQVLERQDQAFCFFQRQAGSEHLPCCKEYRPDQKVLRLNLSATGHSAADSWEQIRGLSGPQAPVCGGQPYLPQWGALMCAGTPGAQAPAPVHVSSVAHLQGEWPASEGMADCKLTAENGCEPKLPRTASGQAPSGQVLKKGRSGRKGQLTEGVIMPQTKYCFLL